MLTKAEIAQETYEELRISGITVNPTGDEIAMAIRRLDRLVASWQSAGICLGYNQSESLIEPQQLTGVDSKYDLALITNLAVAIAPFYGKTLSLSTLSTAKETYSNLFDVSLPQRESNPFLPMGTGEAYGYYQERYYNKYFPDQENAPIDCSTLEIKVGETNYFPIDFTNELTGQTIDSYTVEDGEGVKVLSDSELNGVITLQCEGLTAGYSPIKITITTATSIVPYNVNFNVVAL